MRKSIPPGAAGQRTSITISGAGTAAMLWFVKDFPTSASAVGVASFELLTADGETLTLVDENDNGWLRRSEDLANLIEEVNAVLDQLTDFVVELKELQRERFHGEQLELPLEGV